MQRWIGVSEDDGGGFAKAANVRRQSCIYCHRVEDNAIHLARKLRAFTVRRDDLARQTRTAPRFSRYPGVDADRCRFKRARFSVGSFEPWFSSRGRSRSRAYSPRRSLVTNHLYFSSTDRQFFVGLPSPLVSLVHR